MAHNSLKRYLENRRDRGNVLLSRFDATYTGYTDIGDSRDIEKNFDFDLVSISLPSVRAGNAMLYFDTIPLKVMTSFQYDHDFSMTVMCDNAGDTYYNFIKLLKENKQDVERGISGRPKGDYDGNFDFKKIVDTEATIKIFAHTDTPHTSKLPLQITLYGVRIDHVGNLDFSNSSSELATFTVQGHVVDFSVNGAQEMASIIANNENIPLNYKVHTLGKLLDGDLNVQQEIFISQPPPKNPFSDEEEDKPLNIELYEERQKQDDTVDNTPAEPKPSQPVVIHGAPVPTPISVIQVEQKKKQRRKDMEELDL